MLLLDQLAERRIAEARDKGELQGLPGEGRALQLDEDPLVPETLRVGYRILKNAGFLPPEIEARREIAALEDLLSLVEAGESQIARPDKARRRLALLKSRLAVARGDSLAQSPAYQEQLLDRFGRRSDIDL